MKLTEMEEKVYQAVVDNFKQYYEEGFSDLEAHDIKVPYDIYQVGAILTNLAKKEMIRIEETDVNGEPYVFIHLTEKTLKQEGITE